MERERVQRFDRFRRYPEGVRERIAQAILAALPQEGKPVLLELGVGTGAMAMLLVGRCRYLGLDSDPEMLHLFREKTAGLEDVVAVEADARAIPLPSGSVDGVLVSRFWHLIPDWRGVLTEALRVLRPGGVLLEAWEHIWSPTEEALFRVWEEALEARGMRVDRGLARRRRQEVREALKALGLRPAVRLVARWRERREIEEFVDLLQAKVFHFAQAVPEALHLEAMGAVQAFVEKLGGPHAPILTEKRFYLRMSRTCARTP